MSTTPAVAPPTGPPVTSVADAVSRMQAIADALPAADGLACFNRVYLDVTQQVQAHITQGFFADPDFLTRLDVVFANFYFDAVNAAGAEPDSWPAAWAPLLEARQNGGVFPIQFALAGMNAHINHDLPLALVHTCTELNSPPDQGTVHADYQKVDTLLDATDESVRQTFESAAVQQADTRAQAVVNLVCNWSINSARDAAWDTGLALWQARHIGAVEDLISRALAHTVGMASRGLLVAV
jgi:hypothetical protein